MTPDTIQTADGRTVSLSDLRAEAEAATPGPRRLGWDDPPPSKDLDAFDRETCLALVDEVRRLRDELERAEIVVSGLANGLIVPELKGKS